MEAGYCCKEKRSRKEELDFDHNVDSSNCVACVSWKRACEGEGSEERDNPKKLRYAFK